MEEEVQGIEGAIDRLNALLGVTGVAYKLRLADPREIKLLDKNARYMSEDMFRNLVENIRKDGGLGSMPLCCRAEDGRLLVLSGNHRVQAAAQAGIKRIMVLEIDRALTREEQVSIQLSHNAIEGRDDPVILKALWDEIEDIDLKLYTGLDSELVKELDKVEFISIAEARVDHKQAVFLFLPEEAEQLKQLLEDVDMYFTGDENYVLSRKHYEEVFALIADIKEKFEIVNNPTAMMKVMELARERLGALDG